MIIGFQTRQLRHFINPVSREVIELSKDLGCNAIEFGCGDVNLVDNLENIKSKDLLGFDYISLHAPKVKYSNNQETKDLLDIIERASEELNIKNIIVHPDCVLDWDVFKNYNFNILVENMDNQKNGFQIAKEFNDILSNYNYDIVLDLNHCYGYNQDMRAADDFHKIYEDKIKEYHISGYNVETKGHTCLYQTKQNIVLDKISKDIPLIVESICLNEEDAQKEIEYIKNYLK